MREQNRDPGIMESSNITDAEFKTLVIKMLSEHRGRIDELSENFNKEIENIKVEIENIKKNQSEIDKVAKNSQSEQQQEEKRIQKNKIV